MGGCLSRRSCSSAADDNIRVVHLNGHVQNFHTPITVRHLTGKSTLEQFLCTAAQLVSAAGSPALNPDAVLQPGKVYFLLPLSTLHPDVSPADLASIARRLTAAAKSDTGKTDSSPPPPPPDAVGGGPVWKSPAAARSRTWRPLLDTIKERPVNQKSTESDLQDQHNLLCIWD